MRYYSEEEIIRMMADVYYNPKGNVEISDFIKLYPSVEMGWHTDTPTEDGDYLVKLDVEHNDYPYYVLKWYKGGWYSAFDLNYPACPQHSVLKWQKIEEKI